MILDFNFSWTWKFLNLDISWLWNFLTLNFCWVVQPSLMICDLQWSMIHDLSEPYLALRTCLYGKTLPLFLSDVFWQIFSKCRIFPDIVSGRDIFIFSYLCFWATYFHKMINYLQWSIVFNDHSMLLHRDYY